MSTKKGREGPIWGDGAISDMDQLPSVHNLLSGRELRNLMIWVIIGEYFEPIRGSCETLIVFVSRVWFGDGWGDRRFKDCAPVTLRDWQTEAEEWTQH